MKERIEVGTPEAAAAFAGARSRAVLLALAAREQSLRQLAASTGLRLNLLHYHVARLRGLGLVEIVREEARPGRPVKIYAAAARAFFVPAGLAGGETGDRLSSELRERLARARARSDGEGTLYFAGEDGGPRMRRLGGDGAAEGAEYWSLLDLSRAEAAELAREMAALLARYRGRGGPSGRPYLVHAALAAK
ncbi:MAG TPA: hypothetical protein VF759_06840 [Allosphingosinicella sp.]|jgi:DNA-binding transcriptional ArsR family regulator